MCDKEMRIRLEAIELHIAEVATDVKWLKKLIGGLLIVIAAAVGIDVTQFV